jgi:hypothetical protein
MPVKDPVAERNPDVVSSRRDLRFGRTDLVSDNSHRCDAA